MYILLLLFTFYPTGRLRLVRLRGLFNTNPSGSKRVTRSLLDASGKDDGIFWCASINYALDALGSFGEFAKSIAVFQVRATEF
jgi:hypothetical protein